MFDDNHITIDGDTDLAVSDDYVKRFDAYGWHTEYLGEIANDCDALEAAFRRAMAVEDRPSLLVLRSHIGYPSPEFTDNPKAHGDPFPEEEIRRTKEILGIPPDEQFYAPADVVDAYRALAAERGSRGPLGLAAALRRLGGRPGRVACLLVGHAAARAGRPSCPPSTTATSWRPARPSRRPSTPRSSSSPGLLSGAGDLTGNTGVKLDGVEQQEQATPGGRQIHYGIREHAMGSAMNGMAMHGGILPVGGTFFVFSDYLRPTLRLASLSKAKDVFVFTHDSVGLGEDGPTHQPIEHLASIRAIPGLQVIRPADANETAAGVAHRRRARRAHRTGPDPPGRPGVHRRLGRGGGRGRGP